MAVVLALFPRSGARPDGTNGSENPGNASRFMFWDSNGRAIPASPLGRPGIHLRFRNPLQRQPSGIKTGGLRLGALGCLLLLALGACSNTGPKDYANACDIRSDHPVWFRDLARTERKWGVPPHVILAVMHQESRFESDAKTPRKRIFFGLVPWGRQSSAYGYAQVLDGTWTEYRRKNHRWGARRDRFRDAVDFMGWYMTTTTRRTGVAKSDAYNQYLAYHQGHAGYLSGRYKSNSWLKDVARSVDARSGRYKKQLRRCA